MSDSNIGGRRGRMAKDHLFVVYGIINSVKNKEDEEVDMQVFDIEKAFDKLWIEDSLNDVVDNIPTEKANDKISILYEANKLTKVAVKTPFGLTERIAVKCICQQGGCWGPILCSNSVDCIGKKSIREDKNLYEYKKYVKLPFLSYIDDIYNISKCGLSSLESNACLTTQIELKRLNFNVGNNKKKSKCEVLHIGDKKNCLPLKANNKIMNPLKKWYISGIL